MRILTICSNEYPTPPPRGTIHASLSISAALAEAVAARGHDVTFVSGVGSKVRTRRVTPRTKPLFSVIKRAEYEAVGHKGVLRQLTIPFETELNLTLLDELAKNTYDLVHFHTTPIYVSQPFAARTGLPNVFTLHGVTTPLEQRLNKVFDSPQNRYISISDYQRKGFPGLRWERTVYHGLDVGKYAFDAKGGDTLVFAGRIKQIKGVREAAEVAHKSGKKLDLAGEIRVNDKEYFNSAIRPLIERSNGTIRHVGFATNVSKFFGKGKAFLFPLQWEEPFGLVLIEAMATGTPVIAFARGSVPEIIEDGKTGFLVNPGDSDRRGKWTVRKSGLPGILEAVNRMYGMPAEEYRAMRERCRENVEKRFSMDRMAADYESVYKKVARQ